MRMSEQINDLASALSKAQGEMRGAIKDSKNPFFKSSYADLTSVWDACREALSKNSLAVVQTTAPADTGIAVVTTLMHSSGQWILGELRMQPAKLDPQVVGSTITYARRYALAAIVGVSPEDDDANAASGRADPGRVEQNVKISNDVKNQVHEQSIACLEEGDEHGLREIWAEFDADQKVNLWAMFSSNQRSAMKKLMSDK